MFPRMSTAGPRTAIVALCALLVMPTLAVRQSNAGTEQQLELALQRRITLAWQGQELVTALERLQQSAGVICWLDRRVDPRTPVDLNAADRPVMEILTQLAEASDCGISQYHGIVYFGPRQCAAELLTLSAIARESLATAPAHMRRRWLTSESWSINRLNTPRELLVELIGPAGANVKGVELVPHDLWPARTLPSMTLLDRLVLLLIGFDLTCEFSPDGQQVQIVPIKRPVHMTRSYSIPPQQQPAIDEVLAALPEANVSREGRRIAVSARTEDHEQIAATLRGAATRTSALNRLRGSQPKSAAASQQRFTLKIQNQPVGRVLDQLAAQLGLSIQWDNAIKDGPGQGRGALVSCDVTQVDLDGLMQALLSPAGLEAERAGKRITIKLAH